MDSSLGFQREHEIGVNAMAGVPYPTFQSQFNAPSTSPFDRKNELPPGFMEAQENNRAPLGQNYGPGGMPDRNNQLPPGFMESQEINRSSFAQSVTPGGMPDRKNELPPDWHARTKDCKIKFIKMKKKMTINQKSGLLWIKREVQTRLPQYSQLFSNQERKSELFRNRFDGEPKDPQHYSIGFSSLGPGPSFVPLGPPRQILTRSVRDEAPPVAAFTLRKFTQDERLIVKKVLANVINFMEEDGLQASDVFGKYDFQRNNTISERDGERALYDDLCIEQDKNCEMFLEYYRETNGRINLKTLYGDLDRLSKARINAKQFDLNRSTRKIAENPLASMPKEKLLGYSHSASKVDLAHADKMKGRIQKVKDYFYYQYG